jgi:hypothetical protein
MSARHILRGCSVACAVWFAFAIVAAAEKPDFSGRWRIDGAKSTHTSTPLKNPEPNAPPPPPPPPPPDPNAPPIVITHKDPMLTIQESASHAVQLTTDGQENVNRLSGSRLNRSTSRWDGDRLVTKWTLEADGEKLAEGTDVRSLAENGTVMIDDRTIRWPTAEVAVHIVLRRQR